MSLFSAALYALLATGSTAQPAPPVPTVSAADLERAAKSQPVITDRDIERAARTNRMPTEAELARVPIPAAPRLDALPQPRQSPGTPSPIDLGAIARGFEAIGRPGASGVADGPALLVFISFSMPDATLVRLVDQAARARATLVLRGLVDGSLRATVLRAQRLIGQRKVGFQIDPQAFDRFSVSAVPTFVLLKAGAMPAPCEAGTCYPAAGFVSATGDVSIDYALEHFRRSAPAFERDAGAILVTLRQGGR